MKNDPLNRDENLPPGQKIVDTWPVLDLGRQPEISKPAWSLTVSGMVEKPKTYSWKQFMGFPQIEDVSDFHCVTRWSRLNNHWVGIRFSDIAFDCGALPKAQFVFIKSYDGYTANLPLVKAMSSDVLLVHCWEGQPLSKEHGGPVRMITPQLYAWKGVKWIREIEFMEADKLGYWEQRGYSNTAEPWFEDRYG